MELLVISNFDLIKFGCPHCGSIEGGTFITNGTCTIWHCQDCQQDCAVVGKSIEEVNQFVIRDTDIRDLIGKHPYQDSHCKINSFSAKADNISIC